MQRRQRSWPPGVVALLLNEFEGTAHMPLSASPVAALERGDVAALLEMLRNQRRSLPVVVVSVDTFSERPLVSADDLQKRLLGLAQVVVLGKRAAFAFRDDLASALQDEALARRWGVFGGAVRLYWPGLKLDRGENPFQHRLWVPDSGALDLGVMDALFDDLAWASLHGDVPDWVDSALIQRLADRKAFEALRAASADSSLYEQYCATLERDLEAERAHRAEAVERAASAEGELESLRYHLREANAALTTLRQRAREEHADAAVDGAWTVATFRLGAQGTRDCIDDGIPAEERAEVADAMRWLADPESWANPMGKLSNLGGGVYEYRVNVKDHWNRLFVARLPRIHTVVVLHAYSKKSNELDPAEVKVANERLKQLSVR
ncbi:type II toxin-antitoxin system RelE/ParE family toxin [Anaeromyxobacter oryzae]|uniref:type II toxin-antitoxin system RelE/ParE family toxin n=1 Tax=Anaeromyxobacter oryzae TaxID=2918170 RepID=UPI0020BF8320|nr:type II toxin-antitoxin system RelE/ParE family toxin [Anaeromyxobacter oryzae]